LYDKKEEDHLISVLLFRRHSKKPVVVCEHPFATMYPWREICSLVLVGAFWGCTNPLLRKGSSFVSSSNESESASNVCATVKRSLNKFRQVRVWLPYALNQCGSVLYYFLLASSDLSVAVPVCNALSLVFSCITSYLLGERVDQPIKAIIGSAFVMAGVAICMSCQDKSIQVENKVLEETLVGEL
jgi:drug/metabolite transporter (DMT)-like permease